MDKKIMAALIIIVIVVVGVGIYGYNAFVSSSESGIITIYAADSLGKQLNATTAKFKSEHPNVDVRIEYSGSQDAIRKVTDLNKTPDIIASADYGLINQRLMPNYTSFNLKYARNEMVIAYTNNSKYHDQLNSSNWYQILGTSGVKFGFSDPNSDPAGYRAVMMVQLANNYYNNSTIFNDLIVQNSAITSQTNGTGYVINCPEDLNPGSNIMIRPDVAQMMPSLQSGGIDYIITYKNLAEQQNVSYMVLPDELSLSNTTYEPDYKKIKLVEFNGTNKTKTVTLSPIVYGITVMNNAPQKTLATEFVQLLLSPTGTQIIKDSFQEPISPAEATVNSTDIPSILQQYVVGP